MHTLLSIHLFAIYAGLVPTDRVRLWDFQLLDLEVSLPPPTQRTPSVLRSTYTVFFVAPQFVKRPLDGGLFILESALLVLGGLFGEFTASESVINGNKMGIAIFSYDPLAVLHFLLEGWFGSYELYGFYVDCSLHSLNIIKILLFSQAEQVFIASNQK